VVARRPRLLGRRGRRAESQLRMEGLSQGMQPIELACNKTNNHQWESPDAACPVASGCCLTVTGTNTFASCWVPDHGSLCSEGSMPDKHMMTTTGAHQQQPRLRRSKRHSQTAACGKQTGSGPSHPTAP